QLEVHVDVVEAPDLESCLLEERESAVHDLEVELRESSGRVVHVVRAEELSRGVPDGGRLVHRYHLEAQVTAPLENRIEHLLLAHVPGAQLAVHEVEGVELDAGYLP